MKVWTVLITDPDGNNFNIGVFSTLNRAEEATHNFLTMNDLPVWEDDRTKHLNSEDVTIYYRTFDPETCYQALMEEFTIDEQPN